MIAVHHRAVFNRNADAAGGCIINEAAEHFSKLRQVVLYGLIRVAADEGSNRRHFHALSKVDHLQEVAPGLITFSLVGIQVVGIEAQCGDFKILGCHVLANLAELLIGNRVCV